MPGSLQDSTAQEFLHWTSHNGMRMNHHFFKISLLKVVLDFHFLFNYYFISRLSPPPASLW